MTPSEIPQALAALRGHYKVNGKIVFYDGSLPIIDPSHMDTGFNQIETFRALGKIAETALPIIEAQQALLREARDALNLCAQF